MSYMYAVVLTLLNLVFWVSILFNLPGTWLMVLLAVLVEWWAEGEFLFSGTVLYVALGLAVLGEILEFGLGAGGARQSGGSRRGAALAIAGGVVGAIMGTALPVPVVGTIIGACLGAFGGSLLGDLWAGRAFELSLTAGRGAAAGRLWGTIAKLLIGGVIVILLAADAFL